MVLMCRARPAQESVRPPSAGGGNGAAGPAVLWAVALEGVVARGAAVLRVLVRRGWMTCTVSCSPCLSWYDEDKDPPQLDEVTDWLRSDTKAAWDQLKS